MKTLMILVLIVLISTTAIAGVVTIDRFQVMKNPDGTFSVNFDATAVPRNAQIDLAVLYVEAGTKLFAQSVHFKLKDANNATVALGGFSKTRPETVGKQRAQFLVTHWLRKSISGSTKTPSLVLEANRGTDMGNVDAGWLGQSSRMVIYFTEPE